MSESVNYESMIEECTIENKKLLLKIVLEDVESMADIDMNMSKCEIRIVPLKDPTKLLFSYRFKKGVQVKVETVAAKWSKKKHLLTISSEIV